MISPPPGTESISLPGGAAKRQGLGDGAGKKKKKRWWWGDGLRRGKAKGVDRRPYGDRKRADADRIEHSVTCWVLCKT